MVAQQNRYRRGAIYWWRRVLPIGGSRSYNVRISLRTASKKEARAHAGYLMVLAGSGAVTGFEANGDDDRRSSASDLRAIQKAGLEEALAYFIILQNQLPSQPLLNQQLNESLGDHYQWLIDTGGRCTDLHPDCEAKLRALQFDEGRIERPKKVIAHAKVSQPPVKPSTINYMIRKERLAVNRTKYDIAKQELWVAYRDAARQVEAEGSVRRMRTNLRFAQNGL